ncbi:two-CW domain-containing protein, partial [Candidatus Riflebacteria bacterium]
MAGDMNCWEYKNCGREEGGAKAEELGVCPAYPDHGQDCAQVAGTFCGGVVQGGSKDKIANCIVCDFYNSPHYDRGKVKGSGLESYVQEQKQVNTGFFDKLRNKLLFAFLGVGLISIFMVLVFHFAGLDKELFEAISKQAANQLESVRVIKKKQIENYFKERASDMGVLVETVDTLRKEAFDKMAGIAEYKTQITEKWVQDRMADVHTIPLIPLYLENAKVQQPFLWVLFPPGFSMGKPDN